MQLWLSGESTEDIFAVLPANIQSRRQPRLQRWLQGVPEDSTWTDQFAKFYDFINNCVEFFLPWVLRAAEPLAEIDGQSERPWSLWADFVEFGVDNVWAANLVAAGVITDRALAREIGRQLETSVPDGEPTIEQVRHVLTETIEGDTQSIGQVLNWFQQRATSS